MRVGIDVGGRSVKVGFVENNQIVDTLVVKTVAEGLFDKVLEEIKKYVEENNITVEGIGYGIPGHVVNNVIDRMPNINIYNFDLEGITKKYFPNALIKSTNDANAAALGEMIYNGEYNSCYMITLGTGVGGGLVLDKMVRNGFKSNCGEVGHMLIDFKHMFKCSCGLKGCLETVASAQGIERLARHYFKKYNTKLDYDNLTAKDVFDAAKENDELGSFVLDLVSKYLGMAIANINLAVDVECFYIGGGVAACGNILLDKVKKYYKEYAHYAIKDTDIELAKCGNKAGMLGAAYLW